LAGVVAVKGQKEEVYSPLVPEFFDALPAEIVLSRKAKFEDDGDHYAKIYITSP